MTIFPRRLQHGSAGYMDLDESRLLLATREPMSIDDIIARLKAARLTLEDAGEEPDGRRMRRVNHTDIRTWVRSPDDEPLDDDRLALVQEVFGDTLAWVGPVYRLAARAERQSGETMLSPLPNVLLVKERGDGRSTIVRSAAAAAQEVKVAEDKDRSRYLVGYRYLVIDNPAVVNAYQLRDRLLERGSDRIADIRFENMPMLVPGAAVPNDTLFGQQWNMTQIEAPAGWDISTGTAGIVVCVLDEGCDLTHPDLVYAGTGINLGTMSGDGSPTGSHGTACAGIVAARLDNGIGVAGVAGACQILPAAFVAWSDVEVAAGINWATANGAHVISMSFGWDGWDPLIVDPAIQAAFTAGLVMCVATHNDDGAIRYPATNALVMAVGASDQADDRKSPASPDGECWGSNFGPEISVVAPGVLVPTTDIQGAGGYNVNGTGGMWACVNYPSFGDAAGDYVTVFDGTSAATPHVAGLAALLLSAYPTLTNAEVQTIIERTADKTGTTAYVETPGYEHGTWNQNMGYGRINVHRALDLADLMIRDYPADTGEEPSSPPGGNYYRYSDVVVRIADDDVFVPDDPSKSNNVERGQTNYLYARVVNNGPRDAVNVTVDARITPWVGTQFVYPDDWNLVDAAHVAPTPVAASFASIPVGGSEIAKFTISAGQVEDLWGWVDANSWHPCLLARVVGDNDYAFQSAIGGAGVVPRYNNLAQRNLSVIDVIAGATATLPFVAGHRRNTDPTMELVIDRRALPRGAPLTLSLDEDGSAFPRIDFFRDVLVDPGMDHDEEYPDVGLAGRKDGIVFLDRARLLVSICGCNGILTLERGSRFDCARRTRLEVQDLSGGDLSVKGGRRMIRITENQAVVTLQKAAGAMYPMALTITVPGNAETGNELGVEVAQRDDAGRVVGGAAAVYIVQ